MSTAGLVVALVLLLCLAVFSVRRLAAFDEHSVVSRHFRCYGKP